MQELRWYQEEAVEERIPQAFRKHASVCLTAPCGSGKTTMIAESVHRAAGKFTSATVLAHRRRLIQQLAERCKDWNIPYHVDLADPPSEPWYREDPSAPIRIASRDTLLARGNAKPSDLLITDECHLAAGMGYRKIRAWIKPRWHLGFTATPCLSDGSGFDKKLFTCLIQAVTVERLIRDGFLVHVEAFAPVGSKRRRATGMSAGIYGDPVGQWVEHADGLKTITFCRTLAECRHVRNLFLENMVNAEHIDAATPDVVRERAIADLVAGDLRVLVCTPGLLGVGVDIPAIECVQTLVKNISPVPFYQTVGRSQRPAPGKQRAVLLDHGAAVFEHGSPNLTPPWALGADVSVQFRQVKKQAAEPEFRPVVCPVCGFISTGGECPKCGTLTQAKATRQVQSDRETLAPTDTGAANRFQNYWLKCIAAGVHKGWPLVRVIGMFRSKFGVYPHQCQVVPAFSWGDKMKLTIDVFPAFGSKA